MSNQLYSLGKQNFLQGSIDWINDDIKLVCVDLDDYPLFNIDTDEFLSDVPLLARIATSDNFTTKTSTLGVADADDVTILSVPIADEFEVVVIYKDTGVEGTSPLIAYIDTATGLPATPDGSNINVIWSNLTSKIFAF